MCISNQFPSAKATPFGEPLSWRLSSHLSKVGGGARVAPFLFTPA